MRKRNPDLPNKADLKISIKDKMKIINKRVEEEFDDLDEPFLDEYFEKFRELTKTKSKKRLATGSLSRMNYKQLEDIAEAQRMFLKSPYSQRKSREAILEKKVATAKNIKPNWTLEKQKQFESFMSRRPRLLSQVKERGVNESETIRGLFDEGFSNDHIFWAVNEIEKQMEFENIVDANGRKVRDSYIINHTPELLTIMVRNKVGVQEAYDTLHGISQEQTEEF